MLTAWLMLSTLLYSLQLNTGSFPKPLTEEEERVYLGRAKEGDLEARNVLIERNLRLVAHIMKKYYAQTADQDDLISIGTIGLIKGITTFDPSKGARLATYAARCIENAILSPRRCSPSVLHLFVPKSRLADFCGVPMTDFMDECSQFLRDEQEHRIRMYREALGKKPFAKACGIPIRGLPDWESGRKVISYNCREQIFGAGHKRTGNRHFAYSLFLFFAASMTASKRASFCRVGQVRDLSRWVTAAAWTSATRSASIAFPFSAVGVCTIR